MIAQLELQTMIWSEGCILGWQKETINRENEGITDQYKEENDEGTADQYKEVRLPTGWAELIKQ